jgi:hypothetical protein
MAKETMREKIDREIVALALDEEMDRLGFTERMKELYLGVAPFIQLSPAEALAVATDGYVSVRESRQYAGARK